MRPVPGEVLHFSEDPAIARFEPHVAPTARQREPYVWAVDAEHSASYWFACQCPRAMAWCGAATSATRVHVIEYAWLEPMRQARLYAYRFDASRFRELDVAWVCTETVRPLGPAEPVGELLAAHAEADIELRVVNDLRPWWSAVIGSTLESSGIRLRNARYAV